MPRALDLKGQRFGKLTVLEKAPNLGECTCWKCRCDCGNDVIVRTSHLRRGHTKSCGCIYNKYKEFPLSRKENQRLYFTWKNMQNRCYNPKHKSHENYYDKGIKVCDEWLNDFEEFCRWATNNGFKTDLTIDRIDNNKGYSPENCRWATIYEQGRNRTDNRWFEYEKEKHILVDWARIKGIPFKTLESRVHSGMPIEKALTYENKRKTKNE